jgi:hypothetical protein
MDDVPVVDHVAVLAPMSFRLLQICNSGFLVNGLRILTDATTRTARQ